MLARLIAEKLGERLHQSVIVENKTGGGGSIGADLVAKSPADGYTLLMIAVAHTAHVALYKNLPYDLLRDLRGVAAVATQPLVLTVGATTSIKSLKDFVALAKSRPGELNYGSGGNGTSQHLAMEMLKTAAGIDLQHIPYRGLPPAFPDLISGQLAAMFLPIATALPQVQAGAMRALSVASEKRSSAAPTIPTFAEAGGPSFQADAWHGLAAPAQTPSEIVATLNREVQAILRQYEMRAKLLSQGAEPMPMTAEAFQTFIQAETARYGKVIKSAGIEPD